MKVYFTKIFIGQLSWEEIFVCEQDNLLELVQDHFQDFDYFIQIEQKQIQLYLSKMKENNTFLIEYFLSKYPTDQKFKHLVISKEFEQKMKNENIFIHESVAIGNMKKSPHNLMVIDEFFLVHIISKINDKINKKMYFKST